MEERSGAVTMMGNPLTLLGGELKAGDKAPDFEVLNNDLSTFSFSSYRGKICVIFSVPSLDTPVCDMETIKFNEEAGGFSSDEAILTIGMDLPFAQRRRAKPGILTS